MWALRAVLCVGRGQGSAEEGELPESALGAK